MKEIKEKKVSNNKDENKENNNKAVIWAAIAVVFIALVLVFISMSCTVKETGSAETTTMPQGIIYDSKASQEEIPTGENEKIVEELNRQVEEGYINISMNTCPVFENGNAEGNLIVVNETVNKYPQQVIIQLADTGEEIYRSDAIPVGSSIIKDKLDVIMPKGTYDCIAYFHNLNPVTGEQMGCAGAALTITINN